MSNAIKYTDSGEIRLTVHTIGDGIEIRVSDTGTGIPANQLERVFEEFYQVPGTKRGGTGLGLPYARRLARLLGGDLTLASGGGEGTTAVLGDLNMPGMDGYTLLDRLPDGIAAIVITGLDVETPPRAAGLLRKEELTRERLVFAIRQVRRATR